LVYVQANSFSGSIATRSSYGHGTERTTINYLKVQESRFYQDLLLPQTFEVQAYKRWLEVAWRM